MSYTKLPATLDYPALATAFKKAGWKWQRGKGAVIPDEDEIRKTLKQLCSGSDIPHLTRSIESGGFKIEVRVTVSVDPQLAKHYKPRKPKDIPSEVQWDS